MNTTEYQKAQNLRKQMHEANSNNNKNESSKEDIKKINEQLTSMGCGTKQINS